MQLRAPYMAPVLVCALLAVALPCSITADEITHEQRQAI